MNIKGFVYECVGKGMKTRDIWREAQAKFCPHKVVGWTYVLRLVKEARAEKTDNGSMT